MYAASGDIQCPVASLDFYLSNLGPKCDAFFQAPFLNPKPNVWYAAQAMNKLATMMPRISSEACLSVRYTHHCIRATVATGLMTSQLCR